MNWKGLAVATVGVLLVYWAVKGTYKDVWKALTSKGGSSGGQS